MSHTSIQFGQQGDLSQPQQQMEQQQQYQSAYGLSPEQVEALHDENHVDHLDATIALARAIEKSPHCVQG